MMPARRAILGLVAASLAFQASSALAQDAGQAIFAQRCHGCHVVGANHPAVIAPNLYGIIGRRAGESSFADYSPALKAWGAVWTRATLDRFLADPEGTVPGTRMPVPLPDATQRAAVIAYLATLK